MRKTKLFVAFCIFAFCVTAFLLKTKHLYFENDVQVLSSFVHSEAANPNDVLLKATPHGGAEYLNKIVFLGDSRTYGLKAFSILDGGEKTTQVWTPKSGTMSIWDMQLQKIVFPESGNEITSAEAAAIKKPEILIISLGLNGVEIVKKDYFISEYIKLVNSIKNASPDTEIVLQSMFPVCRSYTLLNNPTIQEGNKWIMEVAKQTGSHYLNTAEVLVDEDGFLIEEYSTDGCHLTPLGLDVQIEYICTHTVGGS